MVSVFHKPKNSGLVVRSFLKKVTNKGKEMAREEKQ
jgi:hypothetical protein